MSRQRIASIEFYQDLDTRALSVITGSDRTFQIEAQASEQIQAQLIPPFVDAYKTLTGREIIAIPAPESRDSDPFSESGDAGKDA